MNDTKLTVRIPRELLENIKQFDAQNDTTITDLIKAYLRSIPSHPSMEDATIVRRLSGTLSPTVTIQDYKQHLERKYGQ